MLVVALQFINKAMQKDQEGLTIGVLDIYGFEIFMVSAPLIWGEGEREGEEGRERRGGGGGGGSGGERGGGWRERTGGGERGRRGREGREGGGRKERERERGMLVVGDLC